jgi:hypothetical protein
MGQHACHVSVGPNQTTLSYSICNSSTVAIVKTCHAIARCNLKCFALCAFPMSPSFPAGQVIQFIPAHFILLTLLSRMHVTRDRTPTICCLKMNVQAAGDQHTALWKWPWPVNKGTATELSILRPHCICMSVCCPTAGKARETHRWRIKKGRKEITERTIKAEPRKY